MTKFSIKCVVEVGVGSSNNPPPGLWKEMPREIPRLARRFWRAPRDVVATCNRNRMRWSSVIMTPKKIRNSVSLIKNKTMKARSFSSQICLYPSSSSSSNRSRKARSIRFCIKMRIIANFLKIFDSAPTNSIRVEWAVKSLISQT